MTRGLCAEAWVNRYQTLIAGVFALVGALLTVWIINAQIKQASNALQDQQERKEIAARAKLLMALNILSNYADCCIRELASLHSTTQIGQVQINVPPSFSFPALPLHAIGAMEKCLEFTRRDRISSVRGVLAWLQIQSARISDDAQVRSSVAARDSALFDAIQLKVLTDKLYNYARGRADDPFDRNIGADEFKSAAFFFDIHEVDFPELFYNIENTNWAPLHEYL